MKLYDCSVAPNPRRARMFLAEKGITLAKVEIDILGGANLAADFLAINPRGLLPVLELDDGTRIDEVMAICRYFEELQPEPMLLGRDARERALVTSRQRKMEFDGMIAASEVFRNQHAQFAQRSLPGAGAAVLPAIPALVERGRQTLGRFFTWLETYLGEAPFVAGECFTMADITAFCAIDFARWVDIDIPADNVLSHAWYARVAARPSAGA
ncbi:MAG: glutathione S-transferase family protein [Gammaproteobacteria bacterium]